MSGICGVLAFDGRQPSRPQIDAMIAPLERRGPDGSRHWLRGPVALGHTLLATTPEALAEHLPLTDPDSGCTVTADCRIDNRDQLFAALELADHGRIIGDGELILRAYLRWGENCPAKLLGDFAFAIWDPRAQHLFCARDHMGMRQLLYHHAAGERFIFATEAEAILAHPGVPRRINEARIADFLADLEGIDLTSTFFEDVFRLPPAHHLIVTEAGVSLRRYWRLDPPPSQLKLQSAEAYAEAFLKVFTEAVSCRLRSPGPVGAMLSGGVDSGSVAAVAARLLAERERGPLHTISAIDPSPETCIETRTILASGSLPGIKAHFINHAELNTYQRALMDFSQNGEPFDYHMTLIRAVYLVAHQQRMRIMLDGVAGDIVLTAGNCVARLVRGGRFSEAIREAKAEEQFWGRDWPWRKALARAIWAAWIPFPLRKVRQRILDRLADRRVGQRLISPTFEKAVGLAERRTKYSSYSETDCVWDIAKRVQAIKHPHLTAARERYDRVASAMAIEPRDPFMDVRLIEFCLSLPAEQLQASGWPKIILRRAMRNLLPETVLWRRGKEHLGWTFTLSLFHGWAGWSGDLENDLPLLEQFVRPAVDDSSNQPRGKALDIEERFKLFFLRSWLRRSQWDPSDAAQSLGKSHAEQNG